MPAETVDPPDDVDPPTYTWDAPICERCWIDREAVWDENADQDLLIGLRLPVRLMEPELEVCSFCGLPTFIGVYVRADPATVPYPKQVESDNDVGS